MKLRLTVVAVVIAILVPHFALASDPRNKEEAVASIDRQRGDLINLSNQIWAFAETALRETRSSKVLADYAEKQGFKVERGVAGMPTAFTATYGSGRPIIGILGEWTSHYRHTRRI
jgi:aminobenzoyl-glutamate utilization protein B